jgi:hypothetical protein
MELRPAYACVRRERAGRKVGEHRTAATATACHALSDGGSWREFQATRSMKRIPLSTRKNAPLLWVDCGYGGQRPWQRQEHTQGQGQGQGKQVRIGTVSRERFTFLSNAIALNCASFSQSAPSHTRPCVATAVSAAPSAWWVGHTFIRVHTCGDEVVCVCVSRRTPEGGLTHRRDKKKHRDRIPSF